MRSERSLLLLLFLALFAQVYWLAVEIDLIPNLANKKLSLRMQKLGEVKVVQNQLRKKNESQLVWDEGKSSEIVHARDSLLTLSQSSAEINLDSGVRLQLSENTLVFLEPFAENGKDERIRIRFSKGQLRTGSERQQTQIIANSYEVTAAPGASVEISTTQDDQISIQVSGGKAKIQDTKGKMKSFEVESAVLKLKENAVVEQTAIIQSAKWISERLHERKYFFAFPADFKLQWVGEVSEIEILKDGRSYALLQVESGTTELNSQFEQGSYLARLRNAQGVSPWLKFEIWRAPTLHLVSPLPRDRVLVKDRIKFIYSRPEGARDAKLIFDNEQDQGKVQTELSASSFEIRYPASGKRKWRVVGFDQEGFEIPAPYDNTIFFENELLEAPETIPSEKTDSDSSPSGQWTPFRLKQFIYSYFLRGQIASADDQLPKINLVEEVVYSFAWNSVPGAEFYILEVSRTPDFRSPILETEVTIIQYSWTTQMILSGKFYWRVASGAKKKMGRFSPAQEVDAKKLAVEKKTIKVKKSGGLSVSLRKKIATPVEKKGAAILVNNTIVPEPLKPIVLEQTPPPDPTPPPTPVVEEPTPVRVEITPEPERPSVYSIGFSALKNQQNFLDSDDSKFNFNGIGLGLDFRSQYFGAKSFRPNIFIFQIQKIQWKSTDTWGDSQGEKIDQLNIKSKLAWKRQNYLGAILLSSAGVPKKQTLEKVEFVSDDQVGLGFGFHREKPQSTFTGVLDYYLGNSSNRYELTVSYDRKIESSIGLYEIGPYLNYVNIRNSKLGIQGTGLDLGLRFGYQW